MKKFASSRRLRGWARAGAGGRVRRGRGHGGQRGEREHAGHAGTRVHQRRGHGDFGTLHLDI